jgi:hypothetical protein
MQAAILIIPSILSHRLIPLLLLLYHHHHHEPDNHPPSDLRHRHPLLHDLQVSTPCNLQRLAASSTAPLFPVRTPATRLPWPTCSSDCPTDRSTGCLDAQKSRETESGSLLVARRNVSIQEVIPWRAVIHPLTEISRLARKHLQLPAPNIPCPSTGGDRFQVGLHIFFSNPSPNGESNPPYSGEYWSVVTTEGFRECQFEETTAAAAAEDRCAEISSSAVTRSLG